MCLSAGNAGEWGGHCLPGTPDQAWHAELATFLIKRSLTDNFYFCLNATSEDTARALMHRQCLDRTDLPGLPSTAVRLLMMSLPTCVTLKLSVLAEWMICRQTVWL